MLQCCVRKPACKWFALSVISLALSGCGILPSNYLSANSVNSTVTVDHTQVAPTLIPVTVEMLTTPMGQALIQPAMSPKPYQVGPFDSLKVIVWGHPELSTVATMPMVQLTGSSSLLQGQATSSGASSGNPSVLIETDGSIFYPYVGRIHVEGLTIQQIEALITKRMSHYIRDPQVTVQVDQYRNQNIYVLGEVLRAGAQPLTDKPLTLMQALSSAGEVDPNNANPRKIFLVRGSYAKPTIFLFDAKKPQVLMIAEHFPLENNDIVYIPAAALSSFNRFINQVLPGLQAYVFAKQIVKWN